MLGKKDFRFLRLKQTGFTDYLEKERDRDISCISIFKLFRIGAEKVKVQYSFQQKWI
jgi:hypothetical protein